MRDFGMSVLSQYDIDVKQTKRVREGLLADTERGAFLLKETKISADRMQFLNEVYNVMRESDSFFVDFPIANKEDEYISTADDGTTYVLKKWYFGRDCDVKKETDIVEGARTLAKLHLRLKCVVPKESEIGDEKQKSLMEEYERHNRELRKIYAFVKRRSVKNRFEAEFLKGYTNMYEQAQEALERMRRPEYITICEQAKAQMEISHGDYNYHNILYMNQKVAITNFEHAHFEIQLSDLYYYLRKVLEKYRYNENVGYKMLCAYDSELSLGKEKLDYLQIRFLYPEKFWKIADAYYHSNKAWISAKNVEKLQRTMEQTEEKERFIQKIFA